MKIIDISWPITPSITAYKDKSIVAFEHTKIFERDNARETVVKLGTHTGTHVDAPAHFLDNGYSIDQLSLDATIGSCVVIDYTHVAESIEESDLKAYAIKEGEIVLFKTRNSLQEATALFDYHFVFIGKSAAHYLARKKIKAVGIDYLGIERGQPDHATHTIFMEHTIAIIEGLRLGHVQEGSYQLICLPLLLQGVEAAPARAVLLQE